MSIEQVWARIERGEPATDELIQELRALSAAEAALRLDEGHALAATLLARPLAPPLARIARLLDARLDVRASTPDALRAAEITLDALCAELDAAAAGSPEAPRGEELPTRARAHHLRAVVHLRHARHEDAERDLCVAIDAIEPDAPARVWILDSFAQLLLAIGAWQEARRVLERLVALRDDALGAAITVGHLARLLTSQRDSAAARAVLLATLARHAGALAPSSIVRLRTAVLEASLEAQDAEGATETAQLDEDAAALERALQDAALGDHFLAGWAALALARASRAGAATSVRAGSVSPAERWLDRAAKALSMPEARATLLAWRARLLADRDAESALEALLATLPRAVEAGVQLALLRAERAGTDRTACRAALAEAERIAIAAGNPLWLREVDDAGDRLDEGGVAHRLARRYGGRGLDELRETKRERVTIVFTDLVSFTPRTQELTPDEVMSTVRGVFELASPLLARHGVRPLTYMGDGLLAIAQGPAHEARALAFAKDYVARCTRLSTLRRALGDRYGLDLRAGLATGPVVTGAIGSVLKLEFAAIGLTTNLAARLQGKAEPGEIVCADETAVAAGLVDLPREQLELKGFATRLPAVRLRP
jgi:class 3 adenylate cyclase